MSDIELERLVAVIEGQRTEILAEIRDLRLSIHTAQLLSGKLETRVEHLEKGSTPLLNGKLEARVEYLEGCLEYYREEALQAKSRVRAFLYSIITAVVLFILGQIYGIFATKVFEFPKEVEIRLWRGQTVMF